MLYSDLTMANMENLELSVSVVIYTRYDQDCICQHFLTYVGKAVRHPLIAEKALSQLLVAVDMRSQNPSLLLGPVCRWLLYNRQIFSSVV